MKSKKWRKSLSKQKIYWWLAQIYRVLRSGKADLIFKRLRCDYGEGDCTEFLSRKTKTTCYRVRIDPKRRGFLNTVIHECIHAIDFRIPDRYVYWLTGRIMKRMSIRQYAHLIIALSSALDRHYAIRKVDKKKKRKRRKSKRR